MGIARLEISQFRNLNTVKIRPILTGFNFFFGKNGSGKTSLLEAVHYLSLARSFRSSLHARVIQREASKCSVFAEVATLGEQYIPVGLERDLQGACKIRINGKESGSIADLASLTPVQLINSHCYNLLEGGPAFRRKYLDWGAFYQSPEFLRCWRHYERALKQRNAGLRARLTKKELKGWDEALILAAERLDELRRVYIALLSPLLLSSVTTLLPFSAISMEYVPGWNDKHTYRDALLSSFEKDIQTGFTQLGPHRADLKIMVDGVPAKDILSRGQQKLFVCAMILTQGSLLKTQLNKGPIYLIDDLPSELDETSKSRLINLLSMQETQVFVTAVDQDCLTNCLNQAPVKMFHVEHGNVMDVE